jgi:hypothetical protein
VNSFITIHIHFYFRIVSVIFKTNMICYFSIFGLAVFSSSLPVNAQDVPPKPGQPTQVQPAAPKQSDQITKAVAGAAASVCALAVTSGSFLIGAACGLVVVVGILKVQGK